MRGLLPLALAAWVLSGCITVAPAPARPATGQIDGAVVDGYLNPYPYQNVTLANLHWVDQTSRLGGFTFRNVPPGTYTLVSQKPGTDGDVKVVEVSPGKTTRVILQMLPHHDPIPFVSILKNNAHTDLALPGSDCPDCAWGTFVLEKPKEIVLKAAWDAAPAGGNTLTLRLLADDGQELGSVTGASPLELAVKGDDLPAGQKVKVNVHFGGDFLPRPVQMQSLLSLYYVADREHQGT
jgi:hypothetical protein